MAARDRSRSPAREDRRSKVLKVAREAVMAGGAAMREAWWSASGSDVKLTKSCAVDLVTETDQKCEEIILGVIQKSFPNDRIIGEESSGSDKYADLDDSPTWTIDPIDGTTNFVHRFPQSCVIIAYMEKKDTVVSFIYDPIQNELFWAAEGQGAWLENPSVGKRKLMAPDIKSVKQAVVSMEVGYGRDPDSIKLVTGAMAAIMKEGVRTIRMSGSCGLDMAYVAAGRFNVTFEHGDWPRGRGPKIWDFAAGKLIVREAGGVTRNLEKGGKGELDLMGRSCFAACTNELADDILRV
eukprot:CAMPEP_0206429746 /NCGR_PEP_ID=MMETSP0324_2-20121206/6414_1 /ASSEMBLY_ACC=CAM_ASM_000836 /TAXON_ID=2866 /ORGANISM="Crypthecodinium cohnii, Strain Seligo" /LENGTH=294 /DNA_ID=CAMNT_0053895465 /DNA_START=74 /DNA_END=955 /DNA_ORIENTATION=+